MSNSLAPDSSLLVKPSSRLPASPRTPFKHQTLDHTKRSIRLLKVSWALTRDGLVQSSIVHSTIGQASYTCFSYMWGPPTPCRDILIDGQTYTVGQNLFDLLDFYRLTKSPASQLLWIDAICIAQADVRERNHQVMQMGEIFSTADFVYVWLGRNTAAAWCVQKFRDHRNGPRLSKKAAMPGNDVFPWLCQNEYWNRAWVTQELVLARNLMVLLDEEVMSLSEFHAMLEWGYYLDYDYHGTLLGRHLPIIDGTEDISGTDLVNLLSRFHDKRCGITLDRVFCLNSLCSPSSRVVVDYEKNPSDLAYEILSKVENLCVCDIAIVLLALSLIPGPGATNSSKWSSNLHLRVRVPNEHLGLGGRCLDSQKAGRIRCQTIADLVPSRPVFSYNALRSMNVRHFPRDMILDTHGHHPGSSAMVIPFVSLAVLRPSIKICSERSRNLPFSYRNHGIASIQRRKMITSAWESDV